MGFIRRAVSKGVVTSIGVTSSVVSVLHNPSLNKLVASTIARFLPAHLGDSIVELVEILQKMFPKNLTSVDIFTALSVVAILQAKSAKPVHDIRQYSAVEDSPTAKLFSHFIKYAIAAYGKKSSISPAGAFYSSNRESIKKHTGLPSNKIHPYVDSEAVEGRPMLEHFVAVDDGKESVIIALKGTQSIEAALKDIRAEYSKVQIWGQEFQVHSGMWRSAQDLIAFPLLLAQAKQELEANPGYQLVVLGHSLGGGVAALLAILLAAKPTDGKFLTNSYTVPGRKIVCYGFEPAASIDEALGAETKPLIYSIVNKNDIIPSLSHGAILDLQEIAIMLKSDPSYLSKIINGLLSHTLDADEHLIFFRSRAQNLKLIPPGRVWATFKNDIGKIEIGEVLNVNQRFGETRFILGMITHHFLTDCAKSLSALQV